MESILIKEYFKRILILVSKTTICLYTFQKQVEMFYDNWFIEIFNYKR